ncbi:MAG: hypothetical protein WD042_15550 [Phycisphaeraceae bacterium]
MAWNLFAVLIFLLPPLVTGFAFARVKSNMSTRRRCTLAFWCSVFFYVAITLGSFVVSGQFQEGLVRVILGFFKLFLPFSLVAVVVCWLALRLKTRDT